MYDSSLTHGQTLSSWYADGTLAPGALHENRAPWPSDECDVVIVGAGMAGLSTAYHLLKRGRSVVVLEKGEIGSGETGRTTAHLASALDDRYYELEAMHGEHGAALAAASHAAAIDDIERIATLENIACDFARVPGYLFAQDGSEERGQRELLRELEAAQRAGLRVEAQPHAPLDQVHGLCLRFENQAQFHPLRYLLGLAQAVERLGGSIFTGTRVLGVADTNQPHRVDVSDRPSLFARAVVVATNSPINDVVTMHTKLAPYRSYVIALGLPKGALPSALYWDTGDPYHYVRIAGDNDLLIVGGEDHKVAHAQRPEQRWQRLERWVRRHVPEAGAVQARWSGQILEPDDSLAFIGRNPGLRSNVFIATGDSGNGLTHGAIAGRLLSDLICEQDNPWAALYAPARKPRARSSLMQFVRENVDVAMCFTRSLAPALPRRHIPRGHGAIEQHGLRRLAVYVDEQGQRHERSARCPHLGCSVKWNSAERSWDCPCHGSRFDPYGRVMTGPSPRDLQAVHVEPHELPPLPNPEVGSRAACGAAPAAGINPRPGNAE